MQNYIAILRGINVSGKNKILMAELKTMLIGLKFENVETYIQSGNIVFSLAKAQSNVSLESLISTSIKKKFKLEVPVIVRSAEELKKIIATNPFAKNKKNNPERLHITFLAEVPSKEKLAEIKSLAYPPDEFQIIGTEVYLHCPLSYGETKLSNKFFETKLKVSATTRNWKTVNVLGEMSC